MTVLRRYHTDSLEDHTQNPKGRTRRLYAVHQAYNAASCPACAAWPCPTDSFSSPAGCCRTGGGSWIPNSSAWPAWCGSGERNTIFHLRLGFSCRITTPPAENENLPVPLRASCPPEVTSTGCRHNQPSGFCPSRQQVTQSPAFASICVRTQARLKGGLTLTLLVVSNQDEGRPIKRMRVTRFMCCRY